MVERIKERGMKTLDEIKTEWAKDHSYENYFEFLDLTRKCDTDHVFIMDGAVTQIAKRYTKEVAMEALKNANEKATYFLDANDEVQIVKSSITSKENVPEL